MEEALKLTVATKMAQQSVLRKKKVRVKLLTYG